MKINYELNTLFSHIFILNKVDYSLLYVVISSTNFYSSLLIHLNYFSILNLFYFALNLLN